MHTGSIIDFYDDPNGLVLKTKMASEQVPGFIKTAQFLEEEHREKLPDDVYALVMIDQGAKLRKYACVDKGNTALSVIYFLENKDKLPEEAQKVAAANLLTACRWYDMQPPAPLMKMAGIGGMLNAGLGAMAVKDRVGQGMARHAKVMGKAPGIPKVGDLTGSNVMPLSNDTEKTASMVKEGYEIPYFEHTPKENKLYRSYYGDSPAEMKRAKAHGLVPELLEHGAYKASREVTAKERPEAIADARFMWNDLKKRNAGLFGRPILSSFKRRGYDLAREGLEGLDKLEKESGVMQPYVDITGKSAPPIFEKVAHQRFALIKEGQNRFPIDTYGDVLEADRWFNDHGESLHPEERRAMCIKLAARADEIGCKVTDYVKKYAGASYAPDGEVRVAVSTRMQYFQDDSPERDMLNGLMNKYAHVTPSVFCEAIRQFDESTGLDYHWDDGVYDPWYTTYGFTKTAEWEFSTHGDKINEEQLKQVVNAGYSIIVKKFGADMADELKKSPVQIFDSLPLDTKRIIMRMANDPQPSPFVVQP